MSHPCMPSALFTLQLLQLSTLKSQMIQVTTARNVSEATKWPWDSHRRDTHTGFHTCRRRQDARRGRVAKTHPKNRCCALGSAGLSPDSSRTSTGWTPQQWLLKALLLLPAYASVCLIAFLRLSRMIPTGRCAEPWTVENEESWNGVCTHAS